MLRAVTTFKLANVLRITGATASQLDYWMRLGLIVPWKDAISSGDHRLFSMVNVIEVATALWLSVLGMSTDRIKEGAAEEDPGPGAAGATRQTDVR